MSELTQMQKALDFLNAKVDKLMAAQGLWLDENYESQAAQDKKAREHYAPGGAGYKAIYGSDEPKAAEFQPAFAPPMPPALPAPAPKPEPKPVADEEAESEDEDDGEAIRPETYKGFTQSQAHNPLSKGKKT